MSNKSNDIERSAIPSNRTHDLIVNNVFRPITNIYNARKGHFSEDVMDGPRHVGANNLRDIGSTAILSMAHRSMLDPLVISTIAMEEAKLRINMMAKPEIWEVPVIGKTLGRVLEAGGTFPIERNKPITAEKSKHIADIFNANGVLGIFPEGTRQDTGRIIDRDKLNSGVAVLALRHHVPVIPVGIDGTRKGDRGPIAVAINPPIQVEEFEFAEQVAGQPPKDIMREVVHVVGGRRIKALMNEIHAGMQDAQTVATYLRKE